MINRFYNKVTEIDPISNKFENGFKEHMRNRFYKSFRSLSTTSSNKYSVLVSKTQLIQKLGYH